MTTLVLLHGFTGSPAAWDEVLAQPGGGVTVLRPALLGHDPQGDAQPPPRDFFAEVDRLLGALPAAGEIHLAGYSLGARLALGMLCRDSARFARVTLLGVHPGLTTDAERAPRRAADERWIGLLRQQGLAAFLDAWEAQPLFASQRRLPEAVQARQRAQRAQHRPGGLAQALAVLGLAAMPDLAALLPPRQPPVHLLAGEHDVKFQELARGLLPHLVRGALSVVAGAGHNLLLEAPAAVARALHTPFP